MADFWTRSRGVNQSSTTPSSSAVFAVFVVTNDLECGVFTTVNGGGEWAFQPISFVNDLDVLLPWAMTSTGDLWVMRGSSPLDFDFAHTTLHHFDTVSWSAALNEPIAPVASPLVPVYGNAVHLVLAAQSNYPDPGGTTEVWTTNDFSSWTVAHTFTDVYAYTSRFAGGLFFVFNEDNAGTPDPVMWVSGNTTSWTAITRSDLGATDNCVMRDVGYANGRWQAAAFSGGTSPMAWYSTNGTVWTTQLASGDILDPGYGIPETQLEVADVTTTAAWYGTTYNNALYGSTDNMTWTFTPGFSTMRPVFSGNRCLRVVDNTTVAWSETGVTWETLDLTTIAEFNSICSIGSDKQSGYDVRSPYA